MTRKEQAAATKQRLIDYGLGIMHDPDLESIDIKTITEACGVSTGTFYHYFASKADYLSVLACLPVDRRLKSLETSGHAPVEERIRTFVHEHFAVMRSNSIAVQTAMLGSIGSDTFNQAFRLATDSSADFVDTRVQGIASWLQEAVERGELDADAPVDAIARLAFSHMLGAMAYRCGTRDEALPDEAWADAVANAILSALQPYSTD